MKRAKRKDFKKMTAAEQFAFKKEQAEKSVSDCRAMMAAAWEAMREKYPAIEAEFVTRIRNAAFDVGMATQWRADLKLITAAARLAAGGKKSRDTKRANSVTAAEVQDLMQKLLGANPYANKKMAKAHAAAKLDCSVRTVEDRLSAKDKANNDVHALRDVFTRYFPTTLNQSRAK